MKAWEGWKKTVCVGGQKGVTDHYTAEGDQGKSDERHKRGGDNIKTHAMRSTSTLIQSQRVSRQNLIFVFVPSVNAASEAKEGGRLMGLRDDSALQAVWMDKIR